MRNNVEVEEGFLTIEGSKLKQPIIQLVTFYFNNAPKLIKEKYFKNLDINLEELGYIFTLSIFEYIKSKEGVTRKQIQEKFGLAPEQIENHLERLKNNFLIKEQNSKIEIKKPNGTKFWKKLIDKLIPKLIDISPASILYDSQGKKIVSKKIASFESEN
ncbi:MAG: hypothetical protein ACTSYB_16600 [Candidatus Helarchaeota archaeon]